MNPSKKRKLFCKRVGFFGTRYGRSVMRRRAVATVMASVALAQGLARVVAIRRTDANHLTKAVATAQAIIDTMSGTSAAYHSIAGTNKCPS